MKITEFHHGDFVCWRRPDRSEGKGDDVRAGSLAHGRVFKVTAAVVKIDGQKKKMAVKDALGSLSPVQQKIVKLLGCFGIPEIEEMFEEWKENGEIELSEPQVSEENIFQLLEIKPGVCRCGCGGQNYVEVPYEGLDLQPENDVALRHNAN